MEGFSGIIAQSSAMRKVIKLIDKVSMTDLPVLIAGDSGTGKELIAHAIHKKRFGSDDLFIPIICADSSETSFEAALKSTITDCKGSRLQCTLFLNGVHELSDSLQAKLFRFLHETKQSCNSMDKLTLDSRIIATTNTDLNKAVIDGNFRKDLFFRLNVFTLNIPSLSERSDDIPLLSYYFLKKYSAVMKKDVSEISDEMMTFLNGYDFPGNVRELENIIERGVAIANENIIDIRHLPDHLKDLNIRTFRRIENRIPTLEEQECEYIKWVLNEVGGNKTLAAQTLGIDRVSLWRKLKKYGLEED